MDSDIKSKIEKLKELGLDEKKIVSLIRLGFEDFLEEMENDLIQASDEDLDALTNDISNIETEDLTTDEATKVLKDLLKKIYGISAESTWNTFLLEYLDQCVEEAKAMEEFFIKLKNDDPEALKQVIAAQQDPDFQAAKAVVEEVSKLDK